MCTIEREKMSGKHLEESRVQRGRSRRNMTSRLDMPRAIFERGRRMAGSRE